MLDLFLNDPIDRPNRLEDKKDLGYHARYARYCLYSSNLENYRTFLIKSATNRAFYKGLQWIFDEDLDAFLMDESGEVRNRIKFVQNIVKPYVEYYRGSAIRMDISATAMSSSHRRSQYFNGDLPALKSSTVRQSQAVSSNPKLSPTSPPLRILFKIPLPVLRSSGTPNVATSPYTNSSPTTTNPSGSPVASFSANSFGYLLPARVIASAGFPVSLTR